MSFSAVTVRGTMGDRTAGTTSVISPGAAITVGKLAFLQVAADNITATDGASTDHSVTDSVGNTWVKAFEYTLAGGGAAGGVTGSLWVTVVTTEIGTGATVTCTFSASVTSKTMHLGEATISESSVAVEAFNIDDVDAGATLSGMTSREYLLIGGAFRENESTSVTEDSDYTGLADSLSGTAGATTTNIALHTGTRIATLTGDNYLATGVGTGDNFDSVAAINEVAGGPAPNDGAASGTIGWAGAATGTTVRSGASTGAVGWAGTSTGTKTSSGDALGAVGWAGSATGEAPLAVQDGAANGTIGWAGSATGTSTRAGDATGAVSWAGSATGATTYQGSATGTLGWTGPADGTTVREGSTTGTVGWAGSATGEAPAEGVEQGSATGTITWAGSATGSSVYSGSVTGTVGWAGTADGTTSRAGEAAGTITWAGEATSVISPPPRRRLEAHGLGFGWEGSSVSAGLEGRSI